ncbi:HoxN/HupN/NixA family nickel/cobalt transporter [Paludibacterium sp.]|uniref:HoxN/HupN/NixA family nickel/cobalt transporter n=2 Tax=Paludibacterium sp. TaxID=1917523 RepID=UPI0025EB2035|nr:HoxN/HupN/NixA family nickel/cobalt transporter [Paludibacterium sp.]
MRFDLSALTGNHPAGKRQLAATLLFLIGVNLAAWAWAFTAFSRHPALLGMAFLAYIFGLRHAVDADHIAAIDNSVRKLMQENQRPFGVGLFFSLGHSSVVVLMVAAIVFATASLQGEMGQLKAVGSVISTAASGLFLLGLAALNLSALNGIWHNFRRAQRGEAICEEQLNILLASRGLIARLLRPLFRMVSKSWHLFPVGFLFGLGFDTTTEIALFAMAGSQAAQGIALWHVMVFPILFAAGMALIDTLDSLMMVGVYGWAFVSPIRKLWYNLTITLVSVLVAVLIGGLEMLGLMAEKLHLSGEFWAWIGQMNDNLANFGYVVVGVFLATWVLSAAIYKWKRIDQMGGETA